MDVPAVAPRRARGLRWSTFLAGVLAAAVATSSGRASHGAPAHEGATSPSRSPDPFAAEMHAAMLKMDAGMAVPPTGDPDRDFARMMIPHHQGAVDMALAELRFGRDERLRRLAQGIIVEQRQEIEVMQRILEADTAAPARTDSAPRSR
jgi:uncharacterized protein (DUF305 family)